MNLKSILFVTVLGSVLSLCAADVPAPAPVSTNAVPTVTTNQPAKVHSCCRPKRPGKHGGGVEIKHGCRAKKVEDSAKR